MAFMSVQKVLTTLFIIVQVVCATNYCDRSLCNGYKHIGCDNNEEFHEPCPNAKIIDLTSELKKMILDLHNTHRNQVAGGGTKLKAACRMATLQWDPELASLAELNVKKCKLAHDCHNTDAFKNSGQNLALITYPKSANVGTLVKRCVNGWYSKIKNTQVSQITSYSENHKPVISNFTTMMAEGNTHIGCAAGSYTISSKNQTAFVLTCDYAANNINNLPVYKACKKPASECKTGKNPKYKHLCSVSEIYDWNKW